MSRTATSSSPKYVYYFGNKRADGNKSMKSLLGGKGANLAEMCNLGMPVPPGFTITTEVCAIYNEQKGNYPQEVRAQIAASIKQVEKEMNRQFGNANNALLFSVRSGAAVSMPGMMDTVLNLGLNDATVAALSTRNNGANARFAWDSYRRFIQMFSNVVMQLNMEPFEHELEATKKRLGKKTDSELDAKELQRIVTVYKGLFEKAAKKPFPQDPSEQLYAAINAVFRSWGNPRAAKYRRMYNIRGLIGTAVNVQGMVFGNFNGQSATGVCFSRNPSNGDKGFYGEYLINAQGEDVVAGIRTPQQIRREPSVAWAKSHGIPEERRLKEFPSMEEAMPGSYAELVDIKDRLEAHYRDMQDIEFTIEDGRLWMLQTRNAKRTALAAVNVAVDLVSEGMIDKQEALMRIDPDQIDQLLHPMIDPSVKLDHIARGLPASPGAAMGQIVFTAQAAEKWQVEGKQVIMVRVETSPEDLSGMTAAQGILTARGGMTSHAAVVARGMGKPCVAGCNEIVVHGHKLEVEIRGKTFKEGDWISLDGTKGLVYEGKVPLVQPDIKQGAFATILQWAAKYKRLGVRSNADTPKDTQTSVDFGAEGVGLCRTEHMFFEGNRIDAMRAMILAGDHANRVKALEQVLPLQRGDFVAMFRILKGRPCTIRLLDPPLHEFVPHDTKSQRDLAQKLGVSPDYVARRVKELHEENPMLGHRGVRLGISYPEIYNIQVQAIMEAAAEVQKNGIDCVPEIMIPLVGKKEELSFSKQQCIDVAEAVLAKAGISVPYSIGTMIEVPRAAITADKIAEEAEFFSFGTNDLTQMGCGFSRDDSASFLNKYVDLGIYQRDPFQSLDIEGVGELIRIAVTKGRATKPTLKIGICGEHGGDAATIAFCHAVGMNYVSCSPFRVPVAIVAAARVAIAEGRAVREERKRLTSSKL